MTVRTIRAAATVVAAAALVAPATASAADTQVFTGLASDPVACAVQTRAAVAGQRWCTGSPSRVRTFDELRDSLEAALLAESQQQLEKWLAAATKSAAVTVDPAVGTWNATTGAIDPPGGRAPLTLVPDGAPGTTPISPAPTTTVAGVPRAAGAP